MSVGIDFYCRVFVRVYESKAEVKKSALKIGNVYQSVGCPSFHILPTGSWTGKSYVPSLFKDVGVDGKCAETGKNFKVGGPFFIAPMHDVEFVEACIKRVENQEKIKEPFAPLPTTKRLHGLLTSVSEELVDVPLFYRMPDLASTLKCSVPPRRQFVAQLEQLGYKVSAQHKDADAVKTDAPNDVLWDVMRNWVRLHPPSKPKKAPKNDGVVTSGMLIMQKEPKFTCDFKSQNSQSLAARKSACR